MTSRAPSSGRLGLFSTVKVSLCPSGVVGDGELTGRSTAMTRWAVSFRSSRRQCSRKANSTVEAALLTPLRSEKLRMDAGGVAPAAQAAEGGHAGVVPAGDPPSSTKLAQLALAHDGVVDAQPGELDLPGLGGDRAVGDHPVVEGAVVLKLQGAEGVGDALQRVLQGVGEVVHGVDAPLVPLAVVVHVVDAVDDRVPHVEVAAGQVDFWPAGSWRRWGTRRPSSGRRGPGTPPQAGPARRAGRGVHVARYSRNSSGVSSQT